MSQYDQATPDEGKLLTEDDEILDLQEFMESGVILATAVASPSPLNPIGEATIPTYEQITPLAKKFINSDNEIYDLLQFLQSGNLKLQVNNAAFDDATYVTSADETARLPNSVQLLGTVNQIAVTNGVLSFAEDLIMPAFTAGGEINLNGNSIVSPNGQNIRIAPGIPGLDWIDLQSSIVNVLESIIFNNSELNNITYNHNSNEFYFNANNDTLLILSSSGITIGADLLLGTHKITSSAGTSIQLIPNDDADGIDLSSTIVRIEADLQHAGEPGNKITFTTATQTNYIGGVSIYDINASGFRLGMGYRVDSISNDSAAYLDTQLMTAYATQTAISNAILGSNNFRGGWDASGGLFPTTGGTGTGGAVAAGNNWRISVAGTLGGEPVDQGDQIIAATNAPGQTAANWIIVNPRVFSVFGRFGSVVAAAGDYSYDQITGLPGTATSGKMMRGTGSGWAETTATYPNTVSANDLLRGSATNVISPLSTQNGSVLTTSELGALRWTALGLGQVAMGSFTSGVNAGTVGGGTGMVTDFTATSITIRLDVPVSIAHGGTGSTTIGAAGTIPRSDGTKWVSSTTTYPDSISINQLLLGTGSNVISALATANSSYLTTDSSGNVGWVAKSYGRIYTGISAGSGNSLTFGASPTEITGTPVAFTLDTLSTSDFTMTTDGRLKYTGSKTKTFRCSASFSCTNAAAGVLQIYKGGVAVTNAIGRGLLSQVVVLGTEISLSTNDYLSLFVNFISGTAAPSIYTAQLSVSSLSDS